MSSWPELTAAVLFAPANSEQRPQLLFSLLSQVKFFRSCAEGLLLLLCKAVKLRTFKPGEVICAQGQEADTMYVVLRGSVTVARSEDDEPPMVVAKLGPAAVFGEAALTRPQSRGATLTALSHATLLSLTRADYESISSSFARHQLESKAVFLRTVPLFTKLTKQSLLKLANFFTEAKHLRGDCIYREGDPSSHVFLIISGEVEFTKSHNQSIRECVNIDSLIGPRNNSKEPLPLRRLLNRKSYTWRQDLKLCIKGAKEMFGEEEVINDCPRAASAYCQSLSAVLLLIGKVDFLRRLQNPDMWARIAALNEKKQGWITARLEDLQNTNRADSPIHRLRKREKRSVSPLTERRSLIREEESAKVFTTEVLEVPQQRENGTNEGAPALRRLEVSQRSLGKLVQQRLKSRATHSTPLRASSQLRPTNTVQIDESEGKGQRNSSASPVPALRLGILRKP